MGELARTPLRVVAPVDPEPAGELPPHDLDAEASVLSAAMLDVRVLSPLVGWLAPRHFYSEAHARIFEALVALHEAGEPCDVVTVAGWLKDRGRLAQVGGASALAEILGAVPVVANARTYARRVHDLARVRRAIEAAQRFASRGYRGHGETQEYLDAGVRELAEVARDNPEGRLESPLAALSRIVHEIRARAAEQGRRPVPGLATGIEPFDALTGGLHARSKTTVAACTGVGKTSFAVQVSTRVALEGLAVIYFSMEQPRDEILARALALQARVDHDRIKRASLSQSDWDRLVAAGAALAQAHLWVDDEASLHVGMVRTRVLAAVDAARLAGTALALVVVDYVQRLAAAPEVAGARRHEQVAHATKGLKLLAQEVGVPVLELAQAKPGPPDPRTKKRPRPTTDSIADSSVIAKEADNVAFLHREDHDDRERVTLILDKQRNGPPGEVALRFRGSLCLFEAAP